MSVPTEKPRRFTVYREVAGKRTTIVDNQTLTGATPRVGETYEGHEVVEVPVDTFDACTIVVKPWPSAAK